MNNSWINISGTVQGKNHQGAVTTLVERQTKVAIVLNSHTKSAHDVNRSLAGWLSKLPRHLFKSITFDNGLLRKNGLRHNLIMDQLSDGFVQAVASRRNHIPRKSLGYQTPLEAFISQITDEQLKNF